MHQSKTDQIKNDFHQVEDDIFFDKITDEAIERAAQAWSSAAFTIGNCTGLGSCPA
jgi:hypothetical protein